MSRTTAVGFHQKYLIGESYGTTRVKRQLAPWIYQNSHWAYLNGVILVSTYRTGHQTRWSVAMGWLFHTTRPQRGIIKCFQPDLQSKDLDAARSSERHSPWWVNPGFVAWRFLDDAQRKHWPPKISRYTGLSEKLCYNTISPSDHFFWKELLRDKGFTIGRLISRYKGIDSEDIGTSPDFNARANLVVAFLSHRPLIITCDVLKYKTDLQYNMFYRFIRGIAITITQAKIFVKL